MGLRTAFRDQVDVLVIGVDVDERRAPSAYERYHGSVRVDWKVGVSQCFTAFDVLHQSSVVDDDAAFEFEFLSPGEGGSKASTRAEDDPEAAAPSGCDRIADRRGQLSIRI